MAARASKQTEKDKIEDAVLRVGQPEAMKQINAQIEKGNELLERAVHSEEELEQLENDQSRWNEYNAQLLGTLFSNAALKDQYRFQGAVVMILTTHSPLSTRLEQERGHIKTRINALRSIVERLGLFGGPENGGSGSRSATPTHVGTAVFVVHGHDGEAKHAVARFIEKLKLKPIILHEQTNEGRTLIEKFEQHAHDGVGFAVVLITPDDIGGPAGANPEQLNSRARQNVILELGYFLGMLGRKHVAALHVAGTELPSDMTGIVYIPLDENDAWKLPLAKEMKAAGLPIDMNDAF